MNKFFNCFICVLLSVCGTAHATTHGVPLSAYTDPHCLGSTSVITHLFEWRWESIQQECPRLAKMGYCGVQTSIPTESIEVTHPPMRPWWERYRVVSYSIFSRSGNESEFKSMVETCNNHGVRIYPNIEIKVMGSGNESGIGMAGNPFVSLLQTPNRARDFSFPAVPYNNSHFNNYDHSFCDTTYWNISARFMRDCDGYRPNLNQSQPYVREKIVGLLNYLIDLGVAGFRIDSAAGLWPHNLKAIFDKVKDVKMGGRPYMILEDPNTLQNDSKPSEYFHLGYVTEFQFAERLGDAMSYNFSSLTEVVDLSLPMSPSKRALIFVDNHDIQRGRERKGATIITHKQPFLYRLAQAYTLSRKYGHVRVMSSFYFVDTESSPPHDPDYNILPVTFLADESCGNGWVCEHRWSSIVSMVQFHNHVSGTPELNLRADNETFSLTRGNRGFFVMGLRVFDKTFQTGLPKGVYCDLISDCRQNITVTNGGFAKIKPWSSSEPMVAITKF